MQAPAPTAVEAAVPQQPPARPIDRPLTVFERFVEESTGKRLPLFGQDLFSAVPGQFAPALSAPVPSSYVLGPGDELVVQTFGIVEVSERLVIDRDGRVQIPKVGPLTLAGVPLGQAEKLLTDHVGKVFRNFSLSVSMGRVRSIEVFVVGQASRPGKHVVSGMATLVNALIETGGPAVTGGMRAVQLRRGGRLVATLDMYQFITRGDVSDDVRLQTGDVIVIPPAGPRAAILGGTDAQAIFELKEGETIGSVLALSGGLPVLANPRTAQLERVDTSREIPRFVENFNLDDQGLRRTLKSGDVLTIFQISPQISDAVTLQGHVAAPMRYRFRPGMKVSDLLADPRVLITREYWTSVNRGENPANRPVVNLDYATIKRLDPTSLRTSLITFNLGRAIERDPAHDVVLQSGDIVNVYSSADIALPVDKRPQTVVLEGEVNIPGTYELRGDETLDQLVARAGGLTRRAYVYGTLLSRESTRALQQANLERVIRRAESEASAQSQLLLQNTGDSQRNNANLQTQINLQNQSINRLRSLTPTGRVALDVTPASRQLPAVRLENGDRINVPAVPSHVMVVGAVTTESAFFFNPADKVTDYLDRAGPNRAADREGVVILRANGSSESARSPSGLAALWDNGTDISNRPLFPGDTIFIPEKIDQRTAYTRFIEGAKDWTSILYQFGLGAAGLAAIRN